jgi:hypothetical protein
LFRSFVLSQFGNDLKQKILVYNGIVSPDELEKKPSVLACPRCELINDLHNKYCSRCSYPLVPSAFEEIKMAEEIHIKELRSKYDSDIEYLKSAVMDLQNLVKHPVELNKAITSH